MIRLRLHWQSPDASNHGELYVRPEAITAVWHEEGSEYTWVEVSGRQFLVDESPAEVLALLKLSERERQA